MEHFPDTLPTVVSMIETGIARGLHSGVQLFVSLNGEVLADCGIGESRAGVPMTGDTVLPLLSAAKPLTAVAILQLVERNQLELDAPVANVIPEFASGGKRDVTVRHLLTHTGGFPNVESGWPDTEWSETLRRICDSPLEPDWRVGIDGAYHVASSWFVLGELIQRLDGREFPQYLRDEICEPLQMLNTWNGMPYNVWSMYGEQLGSLFQHERGATTELPWREARFCEAPSPGGNARGTARELAKFYQCLLNGGELGGRRILVAESIAEMVQRHRVGVFDRTLQHIVDFGLGVILNSSRYGAGTVPYGYGAAASGQTFGHGGSQSSVGFADPACGLVVCYVANGRVGEGRHQRRHRELVEALHRDIAAISS